MRPKLDGARVIEMWKSRLPEHFSGVVDGLLLYHHLRLSVADARHVRVQFERAKPFPRQGLDIDMRPGKVSAGDVKAVAFSIFADTAPIDSHYTLHPKTRQADFTVNHLWDNGRHVTAFIGPFGIVVEEHEDSLRLLCNDSFGENSFDDLVVTIQTRSSSEDRWAKPTWLNKSPQHDSWQREYSG